MTELLTNTQIINIIIESLCAILCGIIVALVYKKTSNYNKNFLITLSLLPFLVMMIMLMVNGNLGTSVAILGAFSLVRFRSLPGTSKEILCVFFSMTIGLALGMESILLTFIITVIGSLFILIFSKIKIYDKSDREKILKVTIPDNLNYSNIYDDELTKYTKSFYLESVKTINMGSLFELTYKIILKNNIDEYKFINELRIKNGNLKIMLSQDIAVNDL